MQLIQNTAKIYQFPVRGQAISTNVRSNARIQPNERPAAAPTVVYDGGWYHGAAIEDSRLPGKH